MWSPIEQPYQVMDGLLVEVLIFPNCQEWAAWVVSKGDGYYYRSFLRANARLEGPFEAIEGAEMACLMRLH